MVYNRVHILKANLYFFLARIKMKNNFAEKTKSYIPQSERRRRKRESILIVVILVVVALLTFAETRIIHFGADFPISNTILMFILININLLLLILLIFLVFRNVVKLLYDRKRKVMGAKLRTRLVVAFITLTLLPTIILFFFSINFITNSIEFWFNVPVEQSLLNSLQVGRSLYRHIEENNQFFIERIAYQVETKKQLGVQKRKALSRYIQIAQRAFNLDAIEVYSSNSQRLTFAISSNLEAEGLTAISANDLQKDFESEKSRTISENLNIGELIRTIGTIPFGQPHRDAEGFVVVTILIPPNLAENMDSISRGFEEYQQIKLLKEPIQITYYITLSIVALLVLFCAIWFGFYFAKSISVPIKELAEGTRRVADGDLSFSIGQVGDDEIGSLVDSFNKMTRDLRTSREQLELSARMLRQQNIEIEERRRYMEIVLKNVSTGVITMDSRDFITTMNTSAEKMLNLKASEILNKNIKTLLKGQHLRLAEGILQSLNDSIDDAIELPLGLTIEGRPRSFIVYVNILKDEAGNHIGIVMVFDDLTELEKAQRMAAWREVARRIAHEVKNPLTPITLSAQRLKRKYATQFKEPVFDECIRMIIDHVEIIRNLVNEFSSFARFPAANLQPCELPPIIEETVALYNEGHPTINFDLTVANKIPVLNIDRQQIKQAMINLIDNAIGVIKNSGYIHISLTYESGIKIVRLEVADNGSGISDDQKARLFEPYFSTKKAGMGLGLTIVSSIIADHKGRIRVEDNQPRGARFIIELPA